MHTYLENNSKTKKQVKSDAIVWLVPLWGISYYLKDILFWSTIMVKTQNVIPYNFKVLQPTQLLSFFNQVVMVFNCPDVLDSSISYLHEV